MTTLPPEDAQQPGGAADPAAQAPEAAAPSAPQPPAAEAPAQPSYQAPQAPQAPQPPQGGYHAPQQPGYGAPGAPGAPQGGYQQAPAGDPLSNITLNYWLSVFFSWIPALIFFIIEKDKGNQLAYTYHRDNLNFSLLRVIVGVTAVIPYIGWIIAVLGGIVLFVFHIMAAAKASETYRRGEPAPFIFNLPMIK